MAGLIAQQPGVLGTQQLMHLRHDRVEEPRRGGPLGHQRRHPPQRGLFLSGPPGVGHVPGGRVDEALLRHRTGAPLEPALGAVAADVPVLEPGDLAAADRAVVRLPGAFPVIGVHEVQEGL
jgi:hypothetical protein